MRYDRPELGERLAADYVLGLMPPRARRRFDRAMAHDATLAALTAGWAERLMPLDEATADETPPAWIWRAIEQRIGDAEPTPAAPPRRLPVFTFWRAFSVAAIAACAAIVLYVAVSPGPTPRVVAKLADKTGLSGWVAAPPRANDVGLSVMKLGISERERPRWLRAALLLTRDSRIIGAVEPPTPAAPPAQPH